MLIVQKFGGSSVADSGRIAHVAELVAGEYNQGHELVVVLSAQGDTTDELIEKAREINPAPPKRELDALLSVGEQVSVSLMAMELEKLGLPALSLTGWQAGIRTDAVHGAARIEAVDAARIRRELDAGKIVIVAGFQGVSGDGDITTLGRGGSDTTAVALAAALGADRCRIYTDVEGVFTADPRKIQAARKHESIAYAEMLELARLGSQVLHSRSVELAMQCGVELEVLSSYVDAPGTTVGWDGDGTGVTGVTANRAAPGGATVSIVGPLLSGADDEMLRALHDAGIDAAPLPRGEISFSALVPRDEADRAVRAVHKRLFE
ncbi:MAG: aspartate kinase [Butyricicoccus sp.]|nr:aspartate kinase [Butyricicoccus sp.]